MNAFCIRLASAPSRRSRSADTASGEEGGWMWNELWTNDADQALSFYEWVMPRLTPIQLEELWSQSLPPQLESLKELSAFAQGRLADFVTAALSRLAAAGAATVEPCARTTAMSAASFG